MPATPQPGSRRSQRLYVTLAPRDVARFKFLLEGYDNLAVMSILDKYACVAQLRFAPEQLQAVLAFLKNISPDISFSITDCTNSNRNLL